jgi:hypothetical protein
MSRRAPTTLPSFRVPLAVLLGAVACWFVFEWTQPAGPGLDPDAVQYVAAAKSLAAHGTLEVPDDSWDSPDSVEPLAHFPPGLSTVLALPVALGADAVQAARVVNGVAALVLIATVFLLASWAEGRAAGTVAAIAVAVTPAVAYEHLDVLSEPLFFALMAIALACMIRRPRSPVVSGIAAAASAMVRYAGVSIVAAVSVWAFVLPGTLRERVRRAALAAAPGIIALAVWMIRTRLETHGGGIREFSVYGQIAPTLHEGARTLVTWTAPLVDGVWRIIPAAIAAAALIALGMDAVRRWAPRTRALGGPPPASGTAADDRTSMAVAAIGVMAACYVAVVVTARMFADPAIPLDGRLLSPLMLLAIVAVVLTVANAWRAWQRPARTIAAVILIAWCGASAWATAQEGSYAIETGNDYADESWFGSPLIAWVRDHAAGRPLYTNYPPALYFHAGRWARALPQAPTVDTARAVAAEVARAHGLVVAFNRASQFAATPTALLQLVPQRVHLVIRTHDGAIYELMP